MSRRTCRLHVYSKDGWAYHGDTQGTGWGCMIFFSIGVSRNILIIFDILGGTESFTPTHIHIQGMIQYVRLVWYDSGERCCRWRRFAIATSQILEEYHHPGTSLCVSLTKLTSLNLRKIVRIGE